MNYDQGTFIQSTLNYFGFPYIFTIILVATIITFLTYNVIKKSNVQGLNDKAILTISFLIGISFAFLLSFVNGIIDFFEYFSGMISIMVLGIFFIILIAAFVTGNINFPIGSSSGGSSGGSSSSTMRLIGPLIIIIFVIIFAFLSFYLAYQNYLIQISTPNSTQGFLAYIILQPPILWIPFLFTFIGIIILVLR